LEAGVSATVNISGGVWQHNRAHWGPCFDALESIVLTLDDGFTCVNNTATSSGGGGSFSGGAKGIITGGCLFSNNTARSGGESISQVLSEWEGVLCFLWHALAGDREALLPSPGDQLGVPAQLMQCLAVP
jgi:hypothetical protein